MVVLHSGPSACRMHSDAASYVPCQEVVDQLVGAARAALRGNMVDRFGGQLAQRAERATHRMRRC